MKNLNIAIHKLIVELVVCVLLVFGSIPLWMAFENKSYAQTAYAYESSSLIDVVEIEKVDTLYNIKNNDIDKIAPAKYLVKNYEEENKIYDFVLEVGKNSTTDYHDINININDRIYDLEKLLYKEDDYCYYFKLTTNTIESYAEEYHDVKIWLDTNKVYNNETFNYQFVIEEI